MVLQEYHAFRDRTALMLFAGSSVLLVLLHRAQARAQANAPYTLTPPIMVRPCAPLSGPGQAHGQDSEDTSS